MVSLGAASGTTGAGVATTCTLVSVGLTSAFFAGSGFLKPIEGLLSDVVVVVVFVTGAGFLNAVVVVGAGFGGSVLFAVLP